jgi:hypothetical protein
VPSASLMVAVNVRVKGSVLSAVTVLGVTDSVPSVNAAETSDTPAAGPKRGTDRPAGRAPVGDTAGPAHTTAAARHVPASAHCLYRRRAGLPESPPGFSLIAGVFADQRAEARPQCPPTPPRLGESWNAAAGLLGCAARASPPAGPGFYKAEGHPGSPDTPRAWRRAMAEALELHGCFASRADLGILWATDPDRTGKHDLMPDGDVVKFRFNVWMSCPLTCASLPEPGRRYEPRPAIGRRVRAGYVHSVRRLQDRSADRRSGAAPDRSRTLDRRKAGSRKRLLISAGARVCFPCSNG